MTEASSGKAFLHRSLAAASFAVVVGGLPIAVELAGNHGRAVNGSTAALADHTIAITTPIRVTERLPLVVNAGRVVVVEKSRSEDGRGPSVVAIDEAHLTIDLSDARSPTQAVSPSAREERSKLPQLGDFSSGALQLKRAQVAIIGPGTATTQISDVNATISVTRKGSYKLIGAGQLNGQRISIDATWTDVGQREATAHVPLRLTLRSGVVEATLDGLFKTGDVPAFAGQAEFRLPSLSRFVSWLKLGGGVGEQIRSVVVAGPLEWGPGQMAFSRASVSVNGDQATGAMTIKHSEARLSVDGTLGFQEFNLGRHMQASRSISAPASDEPHVLTVIDADLRLSAAKVQAPALELGRAALSIALKQGRLQADMAEIGVEGGIAGGQISIDFSAPSPRAGVKLKLKGVDVGRVLAESLRRNPLLGRANLTFDGTMGGRSLGESLPTLAGRGQFDLVEAGRLGLDVSALMHAAKLSNVVGWAAAGKGATPLDTLTGKFRLLNGAVTVESVQARSGSSVLVGSGRVDVPGRLMDMSISAGPAAPTVPVSSHDVLLMRGTWDAPAITLMRRGKPELTVEAPVGVH